LIIPIPSPFTQQIYRPPAPELLNGTEAELEPEPELVEVLVPLGVFVASFSDWTVILGPRPAVKARGTIVAGGVADG
jgi:hypothetical protein